MKRLALVFGLALVLTAMLAAPAALASRPSPLVSNSSGLSWSIPGGCTAAPCYGTETFSARHGAPTITDIRVSTTSPLGPAVFFLNPSTSTCVIGFNFTASNSCVVGLIFDPGTATPGTWDGNLVVTIRNNSDTTIGLQGFITQ